MTEWLALSIGNSRWHWALFQDDVLQRTWNTLSMSVTQLEAFIAHPHNYAPLSAQTILPEVWLASVVPEQRDRWNSYPRLELIALSRIGLQQVYPTLGVDRALALWGAISISSTDRTASHPRATLVIDCGTAMTFTGADPHHTLLGGAILPGLRVQFQALGQQTAALPALNTDRILEMPDRWAKNTEEAIASGILHTAIASIQDFVSNWQRSFPDSTIVMTGGDAALLHTLLKQVSPEFGQAIQLDLNLAFWGIRAVRQSAYPMKYAN
jgi:type III pantothenate kinase